MTRLGAGIPLVGRQSEWRTARDAWQRAGTGVPGALLLTGDAGVGKTRLVTELTDAATADGAFVAIGRCLDTSEAALPYLPFVEIVHQLAAHDPALPDDFPALRRLLAEPGQHGPAVGDDRRPDRDYGQLQLFDSVHAALARVATDTTVVVVVEDLHWADRSSRDLLAYLVSRLSGQRLLLVGTVRSDDLHRRHPLRPLLTELTRSGSVERVQLAPFDTGDATAFVRVIAEPSMPDATVQAIAERSEGNAFLAEELVSASSADVGRELAEMLLARVESLAPETQQVIRLASVIGRRFGHGRLSAAAETTDAALDTALREAVAQHVLVIGDTDDTYLFRHALLHEAVYGDLLPGEKARWHRRVAAAIKSEPGRRNAAELAHHSMESHELPDALAASVAAARQADEVGAPAEALVHIERALRLWDGVDGPESVSGTDELALIRSAAFAAGAAGEPARAIAHSRTAITLADAGPDVWQAAELRRRCAIYLTTLEGHGPEAYALCTEAWNLVSDLEDTGIKARVQASLAFLTGVTGDRAGSGELAAAAIATARAAGGGDVAKAAEADARITVATRVHLRDGDLEQGTAELGKAVALAQEGHAIEEELRGRYCMAIAFLEAGRLPEALRVMDEGAERATATGMTWSDYGLETRVVQVIARFLAGDWDGADDAARLTGESVSGTVITRVTAGGLLTTVGRGSFEAAERKLNLLRDARRPDFQVITLVGLCGTEFERWRGDPRAAIGYTDWALARMATIYPWHLATVSVGAVGIGAYADLAARARRDADTATVDAAITGGDALAERINETIARAHPQSGVLGPEALAWRQQAVAETARLHGRGDPAQWSDAVDGFGYGEPYRQAMARFRWAEALLDGGRKTDRDEAARQLKLAGDTAARLAAEPLATAVRELSDRARLASGATGSGPLTPRERDVLTHAAAGATNKQIGAALYISEKTVSVHLSRVMAKLGASSRTEAVSVAHRRGLLDERPS